MSNCRNTLMGGLEEDILIEERLSDGNIALGQTVADMDGNPLRVVHGVGG